tara:strand:- start:2496 stop:3230 length:735 start_codon:yes stop_codon:yes gene_type:complete
MLGNKRKVLVTGASGGIGGAICEKFIKHNSILILISSSDEKISKLKTLYGPNHFYYKIDLSDKNDIKNKLKLISEEQKDIDIIINNAGITQDNLLLRMSEDQWEKVIDINLSSNFYIIKFLLPIMLSNKSGKIIGISSVVATTGNPGQSNYVSSKSGMIGLYKTIANEVAKRNINVNLISPGYIMTPMTENLTEVQKNNILSKIPMQKFGNPTDVANLAYFLSSDDASYITGQNININGGMLMV